ncbi:MAG TPA: hypothetical protein VNA19_03325 [Pyrinomonadaceae bacterium]|jgi:hypothetical protein|nr:hypothetical protein [Pyrinomonadaceae bacterium]
MSELRERHWAVISERGCEAVGLDYQQAARLMRKLKDERLGGLCVVSDTAARHLAPAEPVTREKSSAKISPAR